MALPGPKRPGNFQGFAWERERSLCLCALLLKLTLSETRPFRARRPMPSQDPKFKFFITPPCPCGVIPPLIPPLGAVRCGLGFRV